MVFSEEDKVAIKFLRQNKLYGAKRLLAEFPSKQWFSQWTEEAYKENWWNGDYSAIKKSRPTTDCTT